MVLGILVVPFAPTAAALYGWTFMLAFSNSIAAPAASGLVSRFAGPAEQGTMLGAAQAVSALGRMLGPISVGEGLRHMGAAHRVHHCRIRHADRVPVHTPASRPRNLGGLATPMPDAP